ncbi:thrombospondin type 3 repeat-containing protein [Sandaracinus amylolyticus]|uniref:thrombospondin type 3 repeat-containing protein n=1 Tax=Sandaracinus amylolyticus TaxID=927083 RepID=UPI001F422E54|nr:thrombospondin type 3 repeat-containing protein [Sandaracinus amylolyticus]UJR81628.1 Flagellar motor rotation protein MotB [Sandaracinus amylolyticus]
MRSQSFASILALTLLTLTSTAHAQAVLGEPSAFRFYQSPGPDTFLGVDSLAIGREWEPSVGLLADYAHLPFALDDYDCLTGTSAACTGRELDVVGGTFTLQLTAAIAFADRVQIGLNLPFIAYTFGDGHQWTEGGAPRRILSGNATTLGDPRIHAKVKIFDEELGGGAHFGLGVVGYVTFPVAQAIAPGRYVGEPSVAGGGHVVLGFGIERLRVALNVGAQIREEAQILESRRVSEFAWGAAAAYDFDEVWGAMAEIQMQTTFGLVFDDEAPTEVRAAGYARVGDLTFTLGAGVGIAYAIGVPIFRVLGGVQWEPRPRGDADHDGLADDRDSCPSDAEDRDGRADEDGCPDLDDDRDGIPDEQDRCPTEAEDRDDHEDDDGCPDGDDDGDGIADGYDSCPSAAEDRDGDRDNDGCPEDDRDRDRIDDARDPCPDAAEDTDGLADEDGCPETDFDDDRVPDESDQCPEQAEDRDGFEDADGCPEEGAPPRRGRAR